MLERDLFYSKYWYDAKSIFFRNRVDFITENLPIYIRRIEYRNKITDELAIVKLRVKKKNLHFTKLWILRFQNWIVINIYIIQPIKKRFFFKEKKKQNKSFTLDMQALKDFKFSQISFLRLVFFFKYVHKKQFFRNNYYYF